MYFLLSVKHIYLRGQVLSKILNFCKFSKIELLYELYNGKILINTIDIKYFLVSLEELSSIVEVHKINSFEELTAIFREKKYQTFAIRTNSENSLKYNQMVGDIISKSSQDLKVNLKNPDVTVQLEHLGKNWYYFLKIK
jgi:adenylyl- and sulfurtransferase ThiI